MASTRNNNTKSDYCLQQTGVEQIRDYKLYDNSQYGKAYDPAIPTLGYTPSHMNRENFSTNPIDIESSLFGINSTNLVEPMAPVQPELKQLKEVEFFKTLPVIMPLPLVMEARQRPFPIPQ
jgi:hypothetical protein